MLPLRFTQERGRGANIVQNQMALCGDFFAETGIVDRAHASITGDGIAAVSFVHVDNIGRNVVIVYALIAPEMQNVQFAGRQDAQDRMDGRAALDVEFGNVIAATPVTATDDPAIALLGVLCSMQAIAAFTFRRSSSQR